MNDIWKIETWNVPSTNRTQPDIEIAGFRITFTDGVVAVEGNGNNPLLLSISYFDVNGGERAYLRDNISSEIIRQKGIELAITGDALEAFVNDTMNNIIVYAIGGATKAERYATIAALGQMYGQTLLPLEDQNGTI